MCYNTLCRRYILLPGGYIYAGVLELADEADSKSVGLITRAGSTPATGTIISAQFRQNRAEIFLFGRNYFGKMISANRKLLRYSYDITHQEKNANQNRETHFKGVL